VLADLDLGETIDIRWQEMTHFSVLIGAERPDQMHRIKSAALLPHPTGSNRRSQEASSDEGSFGADKLMNQPAAKSEIEQTQIDETLSQSAG
jgi:hypothetical protein